jgi:hypothetical protein
VSFLAQKTFFESGRFRDLRGDQRWRRCDGHLSWHLLLLLLLLVCIFWRTFATFDTDSVNKIENFLL